ncbi:MAG: TonB-dependent siderophore receptor [Brevundimonas sp.]|uniref:TonB-dependent receptor n=1 Tax=Brevundimonas sp. TaxID=1871086 RepID=UPI001A2D67BF|nr:TonB-dependent siderophore receptor [Brevundimonas sp.]MBJ7446368.1 TonB-dependent siderophore receptor [Brevundimonas sp.]
MTSRADTLRALLFASSAAGMLIATPTLAEKPGPDAPIATAGAQDPADLGTVNVNGKRIRREPQSPEFVAPLVDTPRAVTIIPQQIIEQTAATSLQDILRTSPGITFGAGEGGQPLADRPFIRGQSSGNNIFIDGIRDTGGQQREVFNLEQIEVVKGPDGVYSGRGSGGGSINLGSKQPTVRDHSRFSLGGGTDNYVRGTIDQNWALGETAGLRLNLMGSSGDVPGRDAVDFEKWGLGLSLGAGLGTDTSMVFSYYHLTADSMPDYGIPLFTKVNPSATSTAPVRPRTESGILDVPRNSFYGLTARDYLINEVDSFTFDARHRFSEAVNVRSVTRYSETLNDYIVGNPADGGYVGLAADGTYWTKRGTKTRYNPVDTLAHVTDVFGRFSTGGILHNYDVGVEYSQERNSNASYSTYTTSGAACPTGLVTVNGTPPTAASALGAGDCTRLFAPTPNDPWTGVINRGPLSWSDTESIGVYAFDSISLTERLILNLGVRYDHYAVEGVNTAATQANGVFTVTGITAAPKADWDFVNYQAGLVFKPTETTSLYASYATSSTPPTIAAGDQNTAATAAQAVLDPEETTSYEVGAKASLFRDQLQLSAAAFRLERQNAVTQTSPSVVQDGEVMVQGVELGVSGNITPEWQVFGGYTWMDSELVKGATTTVGGVIIPNPLNGQQLANTPEHTVSLFSTYRVLPNLTLGGGVYYVSDNLGGNQGGAGGGANRIYAPEYTRVDLFASYDINDRASLQLNIQNAGDEEYILRTNGVHHADPAPARQAILTLNLRY